MNEKEIASAYLQSLTAELDATGLIPDPERPPGFGMTIKEYEQAKNISKDIACKLLASAVKKGLLVKHFMRSGGQGAKSIVYCRPSEWPPK